MGGRLASIVGLHALGALAGYLSMVAGLPLPWMIGPILAAGILTPTCGINGSTVTLRMCGQLVIGAAMGLSLSPQAMARILDSSVPILLSAFLTISVAALLGWISARVLKLNSATAIYSSVPGGPVDMAVLAEHHGGDGARTALAQTIRIVLIVILFPQLLLALGATSARHEVQAVALSELAPLALLISAGVVAGVAARMVRLLNPFFMGPLLLVGGLTSMGLALPQVPGWLIAAGQVLLGTSIGSMFHRDLFRSGPSVLATSVLITLALFGLCIGVGWVLHAGFRLDLKTMIISTAPGGATEMAVTARAMDLDVALVVAFQVVRVVAIALVLPVLFSLFKRFA